MKLKSYFSTSVEAAMDLARKELGEDALLVNARLSGAMLMAAKLTGANLQGADLTGADLRGADLRGADLAGSIFLTQSQVDAARGDAGTRLPLPLSIPAHWPD